MKKLSTSFVPSILRERTFPVKPPDASVIACWRLFLLLLYWRNENIGINIILAK